MISTNFWKYSMLCLAVNVTACSSTQELHDYYTAVGAPSQRADISCDAGCSVKLYDTRAIEKPTTAMDVAKDVIPGIATWGIAGFATVRLADKVLSKAGSGNVSTTSVQTTTGDSSAIDQSADTTHTKTSSINYETEKKQ